MQLDQRMLPKYILGDLGWPPNRRQRKLDRTTVATNLVTQKLWRQLEVQWVVEAHVWPNRHIPRRTWNQVQVVLRLDLSIFAVQLSALALHHHHIFVVLTRMPRGVQLIRRVFNAKVASTLSSNLSPRQVILNALLGPAKAKASSASHWVEMGKSKCGLPTCVTLESSDQFLARTLPKLVTVHCAVFQSDRSAWVTSAAFATRVPVVPGRAVVTLSPGIPLLAATLAVLRVTTLSHRSQHVAFTTTTPLLEDVAPGIRHARLTVRSMAHGWANTATRVAVTHIGRTLANITSLATVVWEPIVTRLTPVAV